MPPPNSRNESKEYRKARSTLLDEEIQLRERIARVAKMRATLPPGGAVREDYEFNEIDRNGALRKVRLSELIWTTHLVDKHGFVA